MLSPFTQMFALSKFLYNIVGHEKTMYMLSFWRLLSVHSGWCTLTNVLHLPLPPPLFFLFSPFLFSPLSHLYIAIYLYFSRISFITFTFPIFSIFCSLLCSFLYFLVSFYPSFTINLYSDIRVDHNWLFSCLQTYPPLNTSDFIVVLFYIFYISPHNYIYCFEISLLFAFLLLCLFILLHKFLYFTPFYTPMFYVYFY